jgi:hypothetical protein
LASEILTRLSPLKQPWAYTSLPEAEFSKLNIETDKGFTSGKRTQGSPIIRTGNKGWPSSSNNDKRREQDSKRFINTPPLFHINSYTMENNHDNVPPPLTVEEICNLDLSDIDPTPTKIYDELVRVLGEAQNSEHRGAIGDTNKNALAGPSNQPPPQTMVEDIESEEEAQSKQTSPALTEDLHPGYPYRENINNNEDLPQDGYPCPYLAAQVNHSNGDPRVLEKAEKGAPIYDEGPLVAQPWTVVRNDFKDEVTTYPLGENACLNTNFLQALGELNDRGLAAECLRLTQLDGEFRYLKQWER